MFLDKIMKKNKALVEASVALHQRGDILPDTYVIDIDTLKENARKILNEGKEQNINLYFMLKQIGRNPYIAKELIDLGYKGAVVVDFKEAMVMMKNQIPIANVGHLVQVPKSLLQKLINYGCEYFTVFSLKKIMDINECARKAGKKQKLLLKVVDEKDIIYSGQTAGFHLSELDSIIIKVREFSNVEIQGVTAFPCFLYNEEKERIEKTNNLDTLFKAKEVLHKYGIEIENVNAPSTSSVETLHQMRDYNINSAEPGHGLSGTTPLHANKDCVEIPCVTYVSEISHNFDQKAYCYGGGYYRRSHIENALVGCDMKHLSKRKIIAPSLESIDYYFGLDKECDINDTVIMAFRFQIFVTRSNVCLIKGLHQGNPIIVGMYTSLGDKIL